MTQRLVLRKIQVASDLLSRGGVAVGTIRSLVKGSTVWATYTPFGAESAEFTAPHKDPGVALLRPRCVLWFRDTNGALEEWRVSGERDSDGKDPTKAVTLAGIRQDLHDGAICIDWTDPRLRTMFTFRGTVAEFWTIIADRSLRSFGTHHFALRYVDEPGRVMDWICDGSSPLRALTETLARDENGRKEFRVSMDGENGYVIDVAAQIGSDAAPLVVRINHNLQSFDREYTTARQATRLVVIGKDGTGVAQATWQVVEEVSAGVYRIEDPEGKVDPIGFDNQMQSYYLRRLATGRPFAIYATSAADQTVSIIPAPLVPFTAGERVEFRQLAVADATLDQLDLVPLAARHMLVTSRVTNGTTPIAAIGADWTVQSTNAGAGTVVVKAHPKWASYYTAQSFGSAPTLGQSIFTVGAPDTATAEIPVDQWAHPHAPVYSMATTWTLVPDAGLGAGWYQINGATIPVALAVGDILTHSSPGGAPLRPVRILAINEGRTRFKFGAFWSEWALGSLYTEMRNVTAYRAAATWARVEAFDAAANTLTLGDGFVAADWPADALVLFARNEVGRAVFSLNEPARELLYGVAVRTAVRESVAGLRNLAVDGYLRDYPVDAAVPTAWASSGTAPVRSTDPKWGLFGPAAITASPPLFGTATTILSRRYRLWLDPMVTQVGVRIPFGLFGAVDDTTPPVVRVRVLDDTDPNVYPAELATYTVPIEDLPVNGLGDIPLFNVPVPATLRTLRIEFYLEHLGAAVFGIRGLQITEGGDVPGGADAVAAGGQALIEASGSNQLHGTSNLVLADLGDPRIGGATHQFSIEDLERVDGDVYAADEIIDGGTALVTNPRVAVTDTVALRILRRRVNRRNPKETLLDVGRRAPAATETLAISGGML